MPQNSADLSRRAKRSHRIGQEQGLRDLGHGLARIHGRHQDALGPVHQLPRLELLLERLVLFPYCLDLTEARDGDVQGRGELLGPERLTRKPSTPASTAPAVMSASVWLVSNTMGHGKAVITRRAASTPSPSGRPTASSTTSGRCLSTSRTASSTRLPLPTTVPP